jgi:hypothetical protein
VDDRLVFIAEFECEGRLALIEVRHDHIDELNFLFRFLVAALGFLFAGRAAFFESRHVGEDELRVDDLDVADWVDRAEFVDDIVVFETTDHLNDRVSLADVGKELVAESGAFRGAFHKSGDVDKLDRRGDQFL